MSAIRSGVWSRRAGMIDWKLAFWLSLRYSSNRTRTRFSSSATSLPRRPRRPDFLGQDLVEREGVETYSRTRARRLPSTMTLTFLSSIGDGPDDLGRDPEGIDVLGRRDCRATGPSGRPGRSACPSPRPCSRAWIDDRPADDERDQGRGKDDQVAERDERDVLQDLEGVVDGSMVILPADALGRSKASSLSSTIRLRDLDASACRGRRAGRTCRSSIRSSMIERRPRAPSLRSTDFRAMAASASVRELERDALHREQLLVLLDRWRSSAGSGCATRSSGVRGRRTTATTGIRPTSSGIRPYLIRSWGISSASRAASSLRRDR